MEIMEDVDVFNVILNCFAYATAKSGAIPGEDLYIGFSLPKKDKNSDSICNVLIDIVPEKCDDFVRAFEDYFQKYTRLDYRSFYLAETESALIGHEPINKKRKVMRIGMQIFPTV
jgi:hypothetical protein